MARRWPVDADRMALSNRQRQAAAASATGLRRPRDTLTEDMERMLDLHSVGYCLPVESTVSPHRKWPNLKANADTRRDLNFTEIIIEIHI